MSQPKFITSPSYDQLHNAAITIVREARSMGWIDAVVAIKRGGVFFGLIASHKLNVPLIEVSYSSKKGKGDDKNHNNILPDLSSYKTVLLVDDLCDSGNTMREIVEHYKMGDTKIITAVFHYKESSVFHPDLYWWRIPEDSGWIVYPFES